MRWIHFSKISVEIEKGCRYNEKVAWAANHDFSTRRCCYMDWLKDVKEHWNKTSDSDWYQSLRTDEKIKELVENPSSAFHPTVLELICKYFHDFNGVEILLPSSGDNHIAFAFALMGAKVTSTDISERQLENATMIASKIGVNINFVCEDTMRLSCIENEKYDLVFTSNGTHSWIADLDSMYQNIYRVLKSSGYSIMYDIHPFNRPFTGEPWKQPQITKSYEDTFPSCHWRMQDLLNANIHAGLNICEVSEMPAVNASFWFTYDELIKQDLEKIKSINDWKCNPMAALPAWLSIVSQKNCNKGYGNIE